MELRETPKDVVEQVEKALLAWVYPQRKHLTNLVEKGTFTQAELSAALERITEAACATLGVERVSVWRIESGFIECLNLYERTGARHSSGQRISATSAPNYFRALSSERVIAAHEARTDPRTAEFCDGYLVPLGITSLLDAPVFLRGKAAAIVCHEHVGDARTWQLWEELVASTLADFVSFVLDAETRARDIAIARAQEDSLQRVISERTEALSESERSLQALLDSAPIPLILTRPSDHRVVYANHRALRLFEAGPDELTQFDTADFWVDPLARERFLARVLNEGSIDDFEVELRTRKGRPFWVRMNAKVMRFRGELTLVAGMIDVTEQREAEQNLEDIFAHAPVALVASRLDDQALLRWNERAATLFEIPIHSNDKLFADEFWVDPKDRERLRELVKKDGRADGFEAALKTARGKTFPAELSAGTLRLSGVQALLVGVTDISQRKRAELALKQVATTDELTQVFNRRHFFELGEKELARAGRYSLSTSLAMLDVDFFKLVNDEYGHAAGDAVLRGIADVLRNQVRTTDVIARIGGEEFVLLFPETSVDGARVTLERIRNAVAERSFEGLPSGRRVTVSIGLAGHRKAETLNDLLRRADDALYKAKAAGRNRVLDA